MRLNFFNTIINNSLQICNFLRILLPNKCNFFIIKNKSINIFIESFDSFFVLNFLSNSSIIRAKLLVDIIIADFPNKKKRFKIIYNLLSLLLNKQIMIKTFLEELSPISSVSKIFRSAPWLEREAWDLFGIYFINNIDLRRILTDYGFKGYPLRKDFPLTGYLEVRHDDSKGDIVYEPVELAQELRFFNFSTGWEKDY